MGQRILEELSLIPDKIRTILAQTERIKGIAEQFKEEMKKWGQENCYIHAPYYINFASSKKSIAS